MQDKIIIRGAREHPSSNPAFAGYYGAGNLKNMENEIVIKGAREHNLKNINLALPKNKMIVFTGLSGSGKSSLAFDTIFAEGQRRYIESLSAYARQFLGQLDKPDIDEITGLSPAISIDQRAHSANPRSTVATLTEIYDYLRVLFARIGKPKCPKCKKEIQKMTTEEMVNLVFNQIARTNADQTQNYAEIEQVIFLAPVVFGRKGEYYQMLYDLYNKGFGEVRIDGKFYPLKERILIDPNKKHDVDLVVDRLFLTSLRNDAELKSRIHEAIESTLEYGDKKVRIIFVETRINADQNTDKRGYISVNPRVNPRKSANFEEMLMSADYSCANCHFSFPEIEPRLFSFNSPYGACSYCHGLGTEYMFSENPCPYCNGFRLKPESLNVLINGKNIMEIAEMSVNNACEFFEGLMRSNANFTLTENILRGSAFSPRGSAGVLIGNNAIIAEPLLKEILNRLKFMADVGLDYLTLDRKAETLSGGEAQRIRLSSQLGSKLTGALYVLDEPTIGLHPKDNEKLLKTLKELKESGNTLIVVEHDPATIFASDYLVDLGPGAGVFGGKVVAEGALPDILKNKNAQNNSLTVQYLTGIKKIPIPAARRKTEKYANRFKTGELTIIGASENNLKNIRIEIPLKRFVGLSGVSGSGKSSLAYNILFKALSNRLYGSDFKEGKYKTILGTEYLDRVILMDQLPIGRTPRSNPATYTGIFTQIRELFAATPEARKRGYIASRFSFNVASASFGGSHTKNFGMGTSRGGRCEKCRGNGQLEIEMHFLPAVYVVCDICKGKRFDKETLEVKYKGQNISDVLKMTINEAAEFFKNIPSIKDKIDVLKDVGLGYLTLGQSATTLSGGEAQRIKLAAELSKRQRGRSFYILDEPTVGLHYEDVKKLLEVLNRLVDMGNTVLIIEHNLDVLKSVDWLIDLGPEGGQRGGEIVACGTPEDIARKNCHTGEYLRKVLRK